MPAIRYEHDAERRRAAAKKLLMEAYERKRKEVFDAYDKDVDKLMEILDQESTPLNCNWMYVLPVFLIIGAIGLYNYIDGIRNQPTCTLDKLMNISKEDRNHWKILNAGMKYISKPPASPDVTLFVYENDTFMSFVLKKFAKNLEDCFEGEIVEMTRENFTSKDPNYDYRHVIADLRDKLTNVTHATLIVDLNDVPGETAKALHTICDTHNPIAGAMIIFMKLSLPHVGDNFLQTTKDYLYELWGSELDAYDLELLVTRVTDQVVPLGI